MQKIGQKEPWNEEKFAKIKYRQKKVQELVKKSSKMFRVKVLPGIEPGSPEEKGLEAQSESEVLTATL